QKHQTPGIQSELRDPPCRTLSDHVRTISFRGNQDFFLSVSLSACSALHSVCTQKSVLNLVFSSASVRSGCSSTAARICGSIARHLGIRWRVVDGAILPVSRRCCLIRRTH